MDATLVGRVALPLLLAAFVVCLIWPLVRVRRQTGAQAMKLHRESTPGQRIGALAFLAVHVGVLLFAVAYVAGGPAAVAAWPAPAALVWLGVATALAGLLLIAEAQRQMGLSFRIGIDEERTTLVVAGLFGWVRNPIFSGVLVMLAGVALIAPSVCSALLWIAALCTIAYQTRLEERHLLAMHGDAYRRYAARTGRFVPGIGRLGSMKGS